MIVDIRKAIDIIDQYKKAILKANPKLKDELDNKVHNLSLDLLQYETYIEKYYKKV